MSVGRGRLWLFALVATLTVAAGVSGFARAGDVEPPATPKAHCGPGSKPETGIQGRVSADDVKSGRAAQGYTCNTEVVSHFGDTGGFRVYRYTDSAGHECAFYDTTLLFPAKNLQSLYAQPKNLTGVYALDMADPAHPVLTASLMTPAMLSPHESLSLNTKRGLLVADMGYPTFNPGFVDVYDVSKDCRHPALQSSSPLGILGHEGTFSPDGNTFWATSAGGHTMTALDLTNPAAPVPLWATTQYSIHGLNVSDDGTRVYAADLDTNNPGLWIFDVSQIQQRVPNPQVKEVSHLSWPEVSIPQVPIPVTIDGHPYLVEIDEYTRGLQPTSATSAAGAARIIDIADEKHPRQVSAIRLEADQGKNRAGDEKNDPGATFPAQGYAGHYCAVPQRAEPGIVACSFIVSGLRVFDIRDPAHPKEMAYANFPKNPSSPSDSLASSFAMSAPAFDPERGQVWYSDGNSGFYNVHLTNGVWPFARSAATPITPAAARVSPSGAARPSSPPPASTGGTHAQLAATGGTEPVGAILGALVVALVLRRLRAQATP